jgi:beta-galactosidase/beta-glucuronidase
VSAADQDGSYPRPMLRRRRWTTLDGPWGFAHDDEDAGRTDRWFEAGTTAPFTRQIEVPFPPESPASGIADPGFHPVVWYRRTLPADAFDLAASPGSRALVHFGAVDYTAEVWCDGHLVATHTGGQTPFTADVTEAIADGGSGSGEHVLVVRAEDHADALDVPRGKQDWREESHGIWYDRTTGIWQTVWCETVPRVHLADLAWMPDLSAARVGAEVTLSGVPVAPLTLEVSLRLGEEVLAEVTCTVTGRVTHLDVPVPALRNGQERARVLWTPQSPVLLDVDVALREPGSDVAWDEAASYVGLRSASVAGGAFRLNGQPYYVRSVLDQGFRPQTHLASRGSDELRAEVETVKAMGFNAVRVHQKAEDPRFLFWADRLGLLVWGETASPYEFSSSSVVALTTEWLDLVRRDRSHPCIVTWVPVNESWGVQDIADVPAQQHFTRALADLTRALDPTRPVLSNEGWEHVDSDILGVHDYAVDPEELRNHYADRSAAVDTVLAGHGPQGRRVVLSEGQREAFLAGRAPLMVTEFGGISLSRDDDSWGYAQVDSAESYAALVGGLFDALRSSSEVVGFCYTQLMDTGHETNGLLYADGTPKLPLPAIRSIVTGEPAGDDREGGSTFGWTD